MKPSIVGFKIKSADLRHKSPKIFIASLALSALMTAVLINITFTLNPPDLIKTERRPFVINMEKIPETRPAARSAAPPRPFVDTGTPIEIDDDIMPDEIIIEETLPDLAPSAESSEFSLSAPGADAGGDQAADFESVEEPPRRLYEVTPEYPKIAERTGLMGSVTLKALVGVEGTVDSVVVMEGPKIFIDTAIDAARRTRFIPAKINGVPVASWVYMPFRFIPDE